MLVHAKAQSRQENRQVRRYCQEVSFTPHFSEVKEEFVSRRGTISMVSIEAVEMAITVA
jgi:hypothetical protein